MKVLLAISRGIDKVSTTVGKLAAWLVLVAVLVSAGNAVIRKAFDMSSNAWLELQWYLYGAVFLLAAAYTLERNEHVRIDFVSNLLKKRTRDWIDLLGHIFFLLPFTVLMVWLAFPWFVRSASSCVSNFSGGNPVEYLTRFLNSPTCEISTSAGGLILWPAKILVLLGFALLTLQAFSEIFKRIGVIRGDIDEPHADHQDPPAVRQLETGYDLEDGEARS